MANQNLGRMNQSLRASATFLSCLRANLVLPSPNIHSNISTPLLNPSSPKFPSPLAALPSSLATITSIAGDDKSLPSNTLDDSLPPTTAILTSESDKDAALELVAGSIAQQRQHAYWAVILHPLILTAYLVMVGMTMRFTYLDQNVLLAISTTGITLASLIAVHVATHGYSDSAKSWTLARNDNGMEDTILGCRIGEKIVGASVLRLERRASNGSSKKKSKNGKTGGKGLVKAWTTSMGYRGMGVGTELLEQAVRTTRERLGNSAEIGFAAEHANSLMLLPEMFNGGFRKRELKAARALDAVVTGTEGGSRKKR